MSRLFAKKIVPYLPGILFVFTSIIYIFHLSPSVYGGDAGDFISAILSFGVPHPSGYPLFTILGILANMLPFSVTPAWKIGLLSVFASSATVTIIYLLVHKLTKSVLLAITTAATLAFFYLFWLYAEIVEVFALNNLFFVLLLYLAVMYREKLAKKYLYIISFVLGLSFANHEITILLVPSLFILVLAANWKILLQWRTVVLCIVLFAAGLFPYLYIPIAASHNPAINWDNASTLQNFLHLVLRRDYSWSLNANADTTSHILVLQAFAQRLFVELTPAGIVLIILGMIGMLKKRMFVLFSALFVGFFLTGPLYILYGLTLLINDFTIGVLERFYLIAALFLIPFLPFGIQLIVEWLDSFFKMVVADKKRRKAYHALFTGVFLILPVMLFSLNFAKTDLHTVWIGDYLGQDLLSPISEKSFIILNTDNVLFNSQYIQLATKIKKDAILDNLVYLPKHAFFLSERQKIKQKNLSIVDRDYATFVNIQKKYPTYAWTNFQISKKKNEQFSWIPYGLGFKMLSQQDTPVSEDDFLAQQQRIWSTFHIPYRQQLPLAARGLTVANIPSIYANGYANIAYYLRIHYNDYQKAKEYYEKSIAVDNQFESGYLGLGYADAALHDCQGAKQAFEKSLTIDPALKEAYISLYVLSNTCLHDRSLSTSISAAYASYFGGSIQKATVQVLSNTDSSSSH